MVLPRQEKVEKGFGFVKNKEQTMGLYGGATVDKLETIQKEK